MFTSLMGTIWPVKEFVEFMFGTLMAGMFQNEIDLVKLEKDIRDATFGELKDLVFSTEKINKTIFKFLPFEITSGSIGNFYLKFPMTYLKDKIEIRIDHLNLEISNKFSDPDREFTIFEEDYLLAQIVKEATKMPPGPILKIINGALNNVAVTVSNISINYSPLFKSKEKIKTLISEISYRKIKDNPKDGFFIYNKEVVVSNLLVKVNNLPKEEDEDIFFKLCIEKKEKELMDFYTAKDVILVLNSDKDDIKYNSILINFIKDNPEDPKNESLKIEAQINKLEFIATQNQLKYLLKTFYFLKETYFKMNKKISPLMMSEIKEVKEDDLPPVQPSSELNILNFKILEISFKISIKNFNAIILENTQSTQLTKPKMWLFYEKYYAKFYFNDDNNHTFPTERVENIQRHFSYLEDNFFLFNISQFSKEVKSVSHSGEKLSNISINEIYFTYVEGNTNPIKKELIVINNIISNELEKYFDEKYSKMFINAIKYDHHSFGVFYMPYKAVRIDISSGLQNPISGNTHVVNTAIITLSEINLEVNYIILLKLNFLLIVSLDEYISVLEKDIKIIHKEECAGHKDSTDKTKSSNSIISLTSSTSVMEKAMKFEKKVKEVEEEKSKTSMIRKSKQESVSPVKDKGSNKELVTTSHDIGKTSIPEIPKQKATNEGSEYRVFIHFCLNVKLTTLKNGSKLFKDFYQHNIQQQILTNKEESSASNFNRYLLKLGENVCSEYSIIKMKEMELILHQKPRSEDLSLYGGFRQLFIFYHMKNIFFPCLIFRNPHQVEALDEEFFRNLKTFNVEKIPLLRKWLIKLEFKNFYNLDDFQTSFVHVSRFHIYSHLIKKNENFIMDDIINSGLNNLQKVSKKVMLTAKLCSLEIEEINFIGFANLNLSLCERHNNLKLYTSLEDNHLHDHNNLEKYLSTEDNIFNIVENPFFKLLITEFKLSFVSEDNGYKNTNYLITSLDNIKLLIRKNDHMDHENKMKYMIFFQNLYEEENFDYLFYKGNSNLVTKKNMVSLLLKFSQDEILKGSHFNREHFSNDLQDFINKIQSSSKSHYTISSVLNIDDFVVSPLPKHLNESVKLLQDFKKFYFQMKILMKPGGLYEGSSNIHNNYNVIKTSSEGNNFKSELIEHEKIFSNNSNKNNIQNLLSSLDNVDFDISIQISRICIDMYSFYKGSKTADGNISLTNQLNSSQLHSELKSKMRIITEIEGISFSDIKGGSRGRQLEKHSNIEEPYELPPAQTLKLEVGKINTIFLKNLDYKNAQNILIDRCENISKENSYWRRLGFCELFTSDNIQILLTQIEKEKNFKCEFILSSIQFYFCRDSFKFFYKFLNKARSDIKHVRRLLRASDDADKESVVTEMEMIQDKIYSNEHMKFPNNMKDDSSVEYKKVTYSGKGSGYKVFNNIEKERSHSSQRQRKPEKEVTKNEGNLLVLDNFDKRSTHSYSVNKYTPNNPKQGRDFNSENEQRDNTFNYSKQDGEIIIDYNYIQQSYINEINQNHSKITEKLNLFFEISSFKMFLFDGKDFKFDDKYSDNKEEVEKKEKTNTNTGLLRSLINLNIFEDYLNTGFFNSAAPKLVKDPSQVKRSRSVQRNYSNYIQINIEGVELKFFYYR
jgi:hypothetical protein